jgi:hypothetical protein
MGSARGPNKRIRKKGRKKEEFEAHFVLDIEIPIQGGPASIRMAMMRARRSRARNAIFS